MTALLEHLDLTALLEYIDLLNRYSAAAAEEVVDMRGGWADPDLFL